jgi:hypothetical protein
MECSLVKVVAILLIPVSAAGCSVVRVVETQTGIGYTESTTKPETETRKTEKLSEKEVYMTLNSAGNRLNFRLQYQPYYVVEEERKSIEYTPVSSLDLGMFLTETVVWFVALFSLRKVDWSWGAAENWQKAALIGIPTDSLLYLIVGGDVLKKRTPWQPSEVAPGPLEWIRNQPYRIDLPEYNFGKDYRTHSGDERIDLFELACSMSDSSSFMGVGAVDVRASTTIDGNDYEKAITISDQAGLQAFHNAALASMGIDMVSTGKPGLMPRAEASVQWIEGELQAGKTAKLEVTVKNTGKGELYRVTATAASSSPEFNYRRLEFGKIDPGESRTLELSFETDELMRTQDIPILIRFGEYNDYTPPEINAKLHIVGKPRPRFDYAYRILDGGTPSSVGNGDGIIQRGESVDIVLTVRNNGGQKAEGVSTTLSLPGGSGVQMFGEPSIRMGDIAAGDSKTAIFNVGVKPNASVESLRMDLSVTEARFGDEVKLTDLISLAIDQNVAPRIVVVHLDGTVAADPADVRSGADSKTSVIAQIPQNSRVKITGQLEDWYRIELDELTGWINAEQITTEEPTVLTAPLQLPEPTVIRVFQRMPPQLTLVSPERDQVTVNTAAIALTAVATDDKGIEKIELMVNGEPMEGRGFRLRRTDVLQTSVTIREAISLSYGENQIKLVAFDTDNQSSKPVIVNATRTREIGELWVLSIGISDYRHISKLNYADDDAKAVADYFRSIGVPSDRVTLLLDGQATVGAIRRAFGELMGEVKKAASVVIYFSGHGASAPNQASLDGDGIDKYLLTCEADPDNLYGTAFPMDEVAAVFKRLASDRVVFIADTCYSGAAGGKTVLAKEMAGTRAVPDYERFLSRLAEGEGRIILTASRGSEISQESPKLGHGIFTYVLLEALRGSADQNGDGFITINEVYDHAVREVPKHANQHPMWKGEASGDVVLGRAK